MAMLLGFIDLIVGIFMVLTHLGILHEWRIAIVGMVYLIGKGVVFRGSFMSWLDIACGVYFLFLMLGLRTILVYFILGYMIYKFVISLMLRG